MRDDGRLVVLGDTGAIVWSSSNKPLARGDYFAQIADSGTLSVYHGTPDDLGERVWKSEVGNASYHCDASLAFYGVSNTTPGAIPVYEFFDPTTNDHTYRTSPAPIAGYYPKSKPPVRFYGLSTNIKTGTHPIYQSVLCLQSDPESIYQCDTYLSPDPTARKSCEFWDYSVSFAKLLPELQGYVDASQQRPL